jgi:hypothetical protein
VANLEPVVGKYTLLRGEDEAGAGASSEALLEKCIRGAFQTVEREYLDRVRERCVAKLCGVYLRSSPLMLLTHARRPPYYACTAMQWGLERWERWDVVRW